MILENKLNISDQVALAKAEEKISKQKAKQLFDSGDIGKVEVGSFAGLAFIHAYLFEDIYDFAGKIRDVNIAKGTAAFARVMHLEAALKHIDAMPQSTQDDTPQNAQDNELRTVVLREVAESRKGTKA